MVRLLDAIYEKGVKVCGNAKTELEQRLQRSVTLHWWNITIHSEQLHLELLPVKECGACSMLYSMAQDVLQTQ